MSFEAIETRTRSRGVPSLAEAVSATGGVAVALGVLLITIDLRADSSGHGPEGHSSSVSHGPVRMSGIAPAVLSFPR